MKFGTAPPLGMTATDKVTGQTGIIAGQVHYLGAESQYYIRNDETSLGWVNVSRVTIDSAVEAVTE